MEQLAIAVKFAGLAVAGCVAYTVYSGIVWVVSQFGGICIGC